MPTQAEINEARRERLTAAAERHAAEAAQRFGHARQLSDVVPFGQPILVGHHSEKRHRALIAKVETNYRKGSEEYDRAQELERRAGAVGHAISADASDAVELLRSKLARETEIRDEMKRRNATIRRTVKQGHDAQIRALVDEHGMAEHQARDLVVPPWGRQGYTWALSNHSANLRRIEQRLADLERDAVRPSSTGGTGPGFEWGEDRETNRVFFTFDGKPNDDVRDVLKSHGFRWAPSQGRWQRQATANGRHAASLVAGRLS